MQENYELLTSSRINYYEIHPSAIIHKRYQANLHTYLFGIQYLPPPPVLSSRDKKNLSAF